MSRAPASTCARVDDDAVRETGGKETFASVCANGARADVDRVATARGNGGVSDFLVNSFLRENHQKIDQS